MEVVSGVCVYNMDLGCTVKVAVGECVYVCFISGTGAWLTCMFVDHFDCNNCNVREQFLQWLYGGPCVPVAGLYDFIITGVSLIGLR